MRFRKRYEDNVAQEQEERRRRKLAASRKASYKEFVARPFQQQQAALNLAHLANKEPDVGLDEGSVSALYLTLTVRSFLSSAPLCLVDRR